VKPNRCTAAARARTSGTGLYDPQVQIRTATDDPTDVFHVAELRLAFLADHREVHPASFDRALTERTHAFVQEHQGSGMMHSWLASDQTSPEPIGVVSVLRYPAPPRPDDTGLYDGYIINMYVRPSHRSLGIGRQLLMTLMASTNELNIRHWLLHFTDDGRVLYESLGFRPDPRYLMLPAS